MKKLFFYLFLFFFLKFNFVSAYSPQPKIFVDELVKDIVLILSDNSTSVKNKNLKIEAIALENVDIPGLGLYTLGKMRKSLDSSKLEEYNLLFEKYFLKSLTSRLTDYSSQKFEVTGEEQKSSNYTIVSSKIAANDKNPEINISWRIYTKNPDKPLVRDLIVEGLSLAKTQKEEFASILKSNNNNIDALFIKLKEFTEN
ncbi:MAG: toluene tolerance protein [Candidatus Pelagibacter sp.]|nr:toluene tolerance protein [Candidatus Pelagibacter sp.]OUW24253.1 MAG: toluene tolerance protein [Rickettsiales bacterium TMED174]|tara:strand:+ start:504 stop:1100 length:597 start_codon:yes stop_codon:yes gene_type:complete